MRGEDVVLAEVGAAAGLAGLTLVFLGIVVGTHQSTVAGASRRVLKRYKNPAWWLYGTFLLSLVEVGLGVAWLTSNGGTAFFRVVAAVFVAQLVAIAAAAGFATFAVLLR